MLRFRRGTAGGMQKGKGKSWREAWYAEGYLTLSRFRGASNIKRIERSGCEPAAPRALVGVSPLDEHFQYNAVW